MSARDGAGKARALTVGGMVVGSVAAFAISFPGAAWADNVVSGSSQVVTPTTVANVQLTPSTTTTTSPSSVQSEEVTVPAKVESETVQNLPMTGGDIFGLVAGGTTAIGIGGGLAYLGARIPRRRSDKDDHDQD